MYSTVVVCYRKQNVRLPYKLKLYPIPDDIRECFDLEEDVTFVRPSILEPLSLKTHKEVFSALLCCEELQIEKNIRVFDMYCVSIGMRILCEYRNEDIV